MTFSYTVWYDNPLVCARTEGVFEFLKTYEMFEEIVATCKSNNCSNILGQSNLKKPMPSADAFELVRIFESVGVTTEHRIAWVAENPALLDRLRLAATALRSRGAFNVFIFEDTAKAMRWLEDGES